MFGFGHSLSLTGGKKNQYCSEANTKRGSFEIVELFALFSPKIRKKPVKQCRRPEIRLGRTNERAWFLHFSLATLIG